MRIALPLFMVLLAFGPASAQDFARDQLERSPRHPEWVEIKADGRTVHTFIAYPERADSTPAVIVIHENRGLTDWVRSFADQLAAAGYLAVAPDLLSGFDAEHQRTSDFETEDAAREALYDLDTDQIMRDLEAVEDFAVAIPSSNGNTIVAGFCWGGSQAFRFAGHSSDLDAALVFYGSAPEDEDQIRSISAPLFAFYGENDQRINATIARTEEMMEEHEKVYDHRMYDGAGHGFMRSGDDPEGSEENRQARDDAWIRLEQILSQFE